MNFTLSRYGIWSKARSNYLVYFGRDEDKAWISIGRFTLLLSWDRK